MFGKESIHGLNGGDEPFPHTPERVRSAGQNKEVMGNSVSREAGPEFLMP